MSEYRYYEFQAHDRPLTAAQMKTLRRSSSRAVITTTRFVNDYHHGEFKGDAEAWIERYFDAFLYLAGRHERRLVLRVPRTALGLRTARRFCPGPPATVRTKGAWTILDLRGDDEEADAGDEDALHCLPVLADIRAGIAEGDARALYLGWLRCVQSGAVDERAPGPPVPPGLARLPNALAILARFLRIDPDLRAAAAAKGPAAPRPPSRRVLAARIAALPDKEKNAWLMRWLDGEGPSARAALIGALRRQDAGAAGTAGATGPSAGELHRAAARRAATRGRGKLSNADASRPAQGRRGH